MERSQWFGQFEAEANALRVSDSSVLLHRVRKRPKARVVASGRRSLKEIFSERFVSETRGEHGHEGNPYQHISACLKVYVVLATPHFGEKNS